MTGKYIEPAIAIVLICGSLWLFQDTLSRMILDRKNIEQSVIDSIILTVGSGECTAKVHLSVWENMNQLEIYRWIVACEDAK